MPSKRLTTKRIRLGDLSDFTLTHYAEHAGRCAGKIAAYALEAPQRIKSLKLTLTAVTEKNTYRGSWDLSDICRAPFPHLLQGVVDSLFMGVMDQIRAELHPQSAENQEAKETKL